MKEKKHLADIKVGLFVTLGLTLLMVAILVLGGSESAFSRKRTYSTHFPNSDGLIQGAKVVLSGITVGTIRSAEFDPQGKNIKVNFSVELQYAKYVREGSTVEILTQGVLGDKYLSISPGELDGKEIEEYADIPNRPPRDFSQMISKGDALMANLNSLVGTLDRVLKNFESGNRSDQFFANLTLASKNFARISADLDSAKLGKAGQELGKILEKINHGQGTLGALVNDPSLYEDARSLVGGANRSRVLRNLVRKTIKDGESKE